MENEKLNVLSLFSGCGGMDLGMEGGFPVLSKSINREVHPEWEVSQIDDIWTQLPKTRFSTVFANDIVKDAQVAWSNYFEGRGSNPSIYRVESIVDLVARHDAGDETVFPRDIDVVTGGFPCQDFSIAGKRKGFQSDKSHLGKKRTEQESEEENRGNLYLWMREVVSITKPKLFIAENVKGLTNLESAKEKIERDFADACDGGYLVVPARVLNATEYGVPQTRERVIFLGFKKDELTEEAREAFSQNEIPAEYDPYPTRTHGKSLAPIVTIKDSLEGLLEPSETQDPDQKKYSKAKWMGRHCQGQIEVDLDKPGPTIRSEHHGNIEFRRLSKEHGGKHEQELLESLEERRLTIRECARIQTFPDDYLFTGKSDGKAGISASRAYKVIGNALPPLLGFHIAMRIQQNWGKYFK